MSTPGSAEWSRQYYGPGWPDCDGMTHRLEAVQAFGRSLAWNTKAKRALRRIDRCFRRKCPAYYKVIVSSPDTGTYNCRPISGTSTPSNHSFGTAIDIRWNENARDGDHSSEMRRRGMKAINQLKKEGLIRWGGDYSSPDDMHVEIVKDPVWIDGRYFTNGRRKFPWRKAKR